MGEVFTILDPWVEIDGKRFDASVLSFTYIAVPGNREVFRDCLAPICEWEPLAERPALLSDPFHAFATLRVGTRECFTFRVCEDCARRSALAGRELPTVPLNGGY